jgi:anti-sigma B factor antagonist
MSIQLKLTNEANSIVIALEGRILSDLDLDVLKEQTSQLAVWNVIFDLSGLTHTNSSGIAFIIKTMTRARINNGDVVLANPNEGIKKLIEISKLYEVFGIYPSIQEAINHFNK